MFRILLSLILFCSVVQAYPVVELSDDNQNLLYGDNAFNRAPEIGAYLTAHAKKHNIRIVVETGTYVADTTLFLAQFFEEVHTFELSEGLHNVAKLRLRNEPHVKCHLGHSEKKLHELLPSLKGKPVLFYLDAHGGEYWPLLDELEEISQTHHNNCIVVIDDFQVPSRPDITYDSYHDHACSFEYVENKLSKVFSNSSCFYLIPSNVASRAKFVAMPRAWEN